MAITTTTITKNAGWARTDVIDQLEQAFTWLGWHGSQVVGLVTAISSWSGGGTTTGYASSSFLSVEQITTTGIGTEASFFVTRNSSGDVSSVIVNKPGIGYTNGEYVTLSASSIGHPSVGLGITVLVAGGASPTGFGSTNAFYDKVVTSGTTFPWGVLRHEINPNKKKGTTYRGFHVTSDYTMRAYVGSAFQPSDNDVITDKGAGYSNRFAGIPGIDTMKTYGPTSGLHNLNSTTLSSHYSSQVPEGGFIFASSNSPTSNKLDLNIYRSAIDPKFAVLSYRQPTIANSSITDNTFATFIIHNFDSTLWDLDHVYLGGITFISPATCSSSANAINLAGTLDFRTFIAGNSYWYQASYPSNGASGLAESGYLIDGDFQWPWIAYGFNTTSRTFGGQISHDSNFRPTSGSASKGATIYTRYTSKDNKSKSYPPSANGIITRLNSSVNYNAVIKGVPLNGCLVPCPYYLPDDFVVIDFRYDSASTNIQQGDTITISGSEVYTVITGSYTQYNETAGILFCARTV